MKVLLSLLLLTVPILQAQAQAIPPPIVLRNANGIEVHLIETGAIVQRLLVPDARGQIGDIVAGFDNVTDYKNNTYSPYFGAVAGRVANRIANASFVLDGDRYVLTANDKDNTLHGGDPGWSARQWSGSEISSDRGEAALFTLYSPSGENGFPHAVQANVTYTLTPNNEVIIEFDAESDGPTPVSMVQHSYFNLEGPGTDKTILDHTLFINASYITPGDDNEIVYGDFVNVEGTPYDFETPRTVGSVINDVRPDFSGGGFDVNYVLWGLNGEESKDATIDCNIFDEPQLAATLSAPKSGRALDLYSQTPGLLLYTGNQLNGSAIGKGGAAYPQHGALCLEAQVFPNFVNEPQFGQCIIRPDRPYKQTLIWRFYNATSPSPSAST